MEGTLSTGRTSADSARPSSTQTQHAIRLLVLLDASGEPVYGSVPADAVKVIRSELRLQATDFWLRNPDYLADELLTLVESGAIDDSYIVTARTLLEDPEPDLRWYPMPKWLHGAYEPLDDAFSLLEVYGLAKVLRRGSPGRIVAQTQFFLTAAGADAVAELATDQTLGWYINQARLVAMVANDDNGTRLKERQYRQATYADTDLGFNIGPIAERVRARLAALDANRARS